VGQGGVQIVSDGRAPGGEKNTLGLLSTQPPHTLRLLSLPMRPSGSLALIGLMATRSETDRRGLQREKKSFHTLIHSYTMDKNITLSSLV